MAPHFQTSATTSQSVEDMKTAVALPNCSESTQESIAGWCIFGSAVSREYGRITGCRARKFQSIEVLTVADLFYVGVG